MMFLFSAGPYFCGHGWNNYRPAAESVGVQTLLSIIHGFSTAFPISSLFSSFLFCFCFNCAYLYCIWDCIARLEYINAAQPA